VEYRSPRTLERHFLVLSRYADVQLALRDPRFGRASYGDRLRANLGDGPLSRSLARWMLFRDPPEHTRLRRLVAEAFTPRSVERLRDRMRAIVADLLDPLQRRSEFDVIGELAAPLPVLVICELLGVPAPDRNRFADWSTAMAASLDHLTAPEAEALQQGDAGAAGLTAYFQELLARRRAVPDDDLLTSLLQVAEDGTTLNEDELLATCVLLFFAGHETTVNLIGNGTLALLCNSDQLQRLRDSPALIGGAIEELLRFDSPVQRTARVALADVELDDGDVIRQDEIVTVLIGAANRDPAPFPEPDQLDLERPNAARHLSVGGGIHYCIGAPLARLEAQIAIAELVQGMPRLQLLEARPRWRPTFGLRALESLSVASGPCSSSFRATPVATR
ncbi:MAG: cytochrome P450, partial [Chloroflexi bacterium]|nr:cytochrome P450 [Chloroflexota bacterium]